MFTERFQTFSEANRSLRPGDLLLWKAGWNPASLLIGIFGRAGISHAAQVKGRPNRWQVQEVVQWHGGQVPAAQGGNRTGAWADPLVCGQRRRPVAGVEPGIGGPRVRPSHRLPLRLVEPAEGWAAALSARRLLLGCLLIRQATDDRAGEGPAPFCSQAVAIAARAGGVDPVPHLADDCTEPADLARSLFYEYRATLVPDSMG